MFTWSDLQAKQNNELLKNLGNFVNRALAFIAKPEGIAFAVQHAALWVLRERRGRGIVCSRAAFLLLGCVVSDGAWSCEWCSRASIVGACSAV